jgi:serine/threonine-protein kinase
MTDPRVGTQLAGHRIVGVIGRGGMSVVYLAEHIGLGRKVALKVLGPALAEDDAFRRRFIRESRITAGLDHPNIVTVYDAGESDGVLYISMRYVEGTDLERLLRTETRLDPDRAVSLASKAAAALDAAHAAGLVHRDVKPGNILLAWDARSSTDRAYLSDFGVTKREATGAALTRSGQFVGTVDYVSPEQIRGGNVDGRADVYSLGCVLYRCLTGEVPFPRDTEVATIYAHLQDPPPVPSEHWRELAVGFDEPISRALAKAPDDRYATCGRFADAVGAVVNPIRSVEVAPTERSRVNASRRRITFVMGSVAIVVGVVVAATLLFLAPDRGRPSQSTSPNAAANPLPQLTWTSGLVGANGFDAPDHQVIADVAVVSGTIVAVGRDAAGGDGDAAVWTSADGKRWTPAPGASLGRIGEQRTDAVTTIGHELVAVGSERTGGDTDPAVWRSPDRGSTWTRVEGATSGLHESGDQAMQIVVEATPGVVAAGVDTSPAGDLDAAVWTSKDGSSWNRLTLSLLTGPGDQQILGAETMGDRLIAVGSSTSPNGDREAAVWVRAGGAWTTVADGSLGGVGDQQIDAVVAGDSGLVAVGSATSDGDIDAAVWTSADGRNWDRVPATGTAFGGAGDQRMVSVIWVDGILVAGGSSTMNRGDADGAIWLSADGTHWERAPATLAEGVGRQRISSLVPLDSNRLLAVGSMERAHHDQAAAWIAKLIRPDSSA